MFKLEFSLRYKTKIPLEPIETPADFINFRKKTLEKFRASIENGHKKTQGSVEKIDTSMEPSVLVVHFDEGFSGRSRHEIVNAHRSRKPTNYILVGNPLNQTIQPDSRIVIAAMNGTLNQYGVACREDAGVGYILLSDILQQIDQKAVGSKLKNSIVLEDVPLHYRSRDLPETKGYVDFVIHQMDMGPDIQIETKIQPHHNVERNVPLFQSMMNGYLSRFSVELGNFLPISKGSEQLNCPIYPSENTFIGADANSGFNGPLPTYLRYNNLDISPSFYISTMRILIDRHYPSGRYRRSTMDQKIGQKSKLDVVEEPTEPSSSNLNSRL